MEEFNALLINLIPLFLAIILFIIIFNTWYIANKVKNQTEKMVRDFEYEIEQRIRLIGDMIKEVGKYAKSKTKGMFNKNFSFMVAKLSIATVSELGRSLINEIEQVVDSAVQLAKKHPKILSSFKFKSLKDELDRVQKTIKAGEDLCKRLEEKIKEKSTKFPFNILSKFSFNIDKTKKKNKTEDVEGVKKTVQEKKKNSVKKSNKKVKSKESLVKKEKEVKKITKVKKINKK